jgi:cathepsin B
MIRTILPLLAIGAMTILYLYNPIEDSNKLEEIAKRINSDSTSTWTATTNVKKVHKNGNLKRMFNLKIESEYPKEFSKRPQLLNKIDLPENFDARQAWPQCTSISEVRDQSACGSCWAFGAATAMSDRVCIHSVKLNLEPDQRRVSPEDLLECCHDCGYGCEGGWLFQSWAYFKKVGIVTGDLYKDTKTCKPYEFPSCNHHIHNPDRDDCSKHDYKTPQCRKQCTNSQYDKEYAQDLIRGSTVYGLQTEKEMMEELVNNGPFEVAITVYEDFLTYKSGVYQYKQGDELGGHAVRILGYGVENGVKYWLCSNSWNSDWGDQGFFKILRGVNHCGIEDSGVAGLV